MAKNEAKIQFTADCKEFNSQISKANSTMQELRAELRLNETQMKANGVSVESLEAKHRILSAQVDTSRSKTEALSNKLEAAVRNFGENSTEAAKYRTQLLNAQTAQAKLEQAVAACENELADQRAAANQAESALENLTNTIEEQQNKLNKLKSQYSDAVLEHGKYSKEARTLAKQVDTLSDELDHNRKRMAEVEAAADKLDNSLDNVDETAEAVAEGFTVMKGAMADLVADGIEATVSGLAGITKEAFTMANDIDKATNTFIAKTGASKDSAEEFEDVMTSIYNNNYGESFEDIADSMSTIKTAMGDIGTAELESVTTKALILRDTFDMDVNESIRAANSMMDQFGITADDAYNLIVQGAQNGLNQNDDLLDTVNEYSVQFKNAGYSAEDMFNMLANGVDAGTWSVDKLGDAVKEFNIRASDGTVGEAIKENAKAFGLSKNEAKALAKEVESGSVGAYQKLADQLRSVDDDTKRYQLGVSMFGTMWEDLGEDAVMALLDTQGEISTTKDALAEIDSVKYDDLGSALEGIGRNLQTSLAEPIQNDVMPAVNEFIEDVDWQGVGESVGSAFGTCVEGAIALVTAVKDATQWMAEHKAVMATVATVVGVVATAITAYNAVQAVKTAMDAAQVTTVWGLVAAHWAQATAAMAALAPYLLIVAAIAAVIAIIVLCVKHWDEIKEAVGKAWNSIKEKTTEAVGKVTAKFSEMKEKATAKCQEMKEKATEKFQALKESASEKFQSMKENASKKFQSMKESMGKIMQSAKDTVSDKLSNMKSAYDKHGGGIKGIASAAMEGVKGYYSSGYAVVDKLTGGKLSEVASKFKSKMSEAKEAVSSRFANIKSAFSSGLSNAVSTVSSKLGSIKSKFSSILENAKSIVKNAIDKIKGFFNFQWSLPKIKLPHFKITGKFSLNPPSIPKFSISWYKDGAIFTKPTLFNTPYGMKGVGEAGAEAVLPIDKLEGYISGAIDKAQNVVNLQSLADAIESLASRPIQLNINDRQFATATASASDNVNGLRTSFKNRGLSID